MSSFSPMGGAMVSDKEPTNIMPLILLLILASMQAAPPRLSRQPATPSAPVAPPEKSAYLAFVDREFIFTVEVVKPGVPLFNFISMSDKDYNLLAKDVRLTLENRKVPGKIFMVDTGDPKEPMTVASVHMRPRSSFGARLQGDFGAEKELLGAVVRVGDQDMKLVPVTGFDFENLALKVNRLNLGSPDFTDDWRVLKLEAIGTRGPTSRR